MGYVIAFIVGTYFGIAIMCQYSARKMMNNDTLSYKRRLVDKYVFDKD